MKTATPSRTRCQIYTRVMGYYRPVSHFNIGKKAEHYNRVHFQETSTPNETFIHTYPARDVDCMNPENHAGGLSR